VGEGGRKVEEGTWVVGVGEGEVGEGGGEAREVLVESESKGEVGERKRQVILVDNYYYLAFPLSLYPLYLSLSLSLSPFLHTTVFWNCESVGKDRWVSEGGRQAISWSNFSPRVRWAREGGSWSIFLLKTDEG
jgi:hypothetical protein